MDITQRHNKDEVLQHWEHDCVESMYDKNLLKAEIELIIELIPHNSKILDAGCGEGEGTLVYSSISGVVVHAVDFSETRLKKATERLAGQQNVIFRKVDFLGDYILDTDYDVIVSQRFLINLLEWEMQKRVIMALMSKLKTGGRLVMLEGSKQGTEALNEFRSLWGLDTIPVKWHNLFFDDDILTNFMETSNFKLIKHDGLGTYFLLTRGIRPIFDKDLNWDCKFNRLAADKKVKDILKMDNTRFSRLKLWVFEK
jgi:SAM-dependent methyltransferase